MNELDLNPFEAARKGGLERSFINDLLIERRKSVRGDNIFKLANALEWEMPETMRHLGVIPANVAIPEAIEPSKVNVVQLQTMMTSAFVAFGLPAPSAGELAHSLIAAAEEIPVGQADIEVDRVAKLISTSLIKLFTAKGLRLDGDAIDQIMPRPALRAVK